MRGAPQSGFSKLICPISARNSIDPRAPSPIPRFPPPVAAKSSPMPTDQRLRPDDLNNLQHRRKPAIQLDEEQTISVVKPNPSPALPLQDNQLLSERCDLGLEPRLGSEWRGQDGQNEPEKLDHPVNLRDSLSPSNGMRFSVHTGIGEPLTPASFIKLC